MRLKCQGVSGLIAAGYKKNNPETTGIGLRALPGNRKPLKCMEENRISVIMVNFPRKKS